MSSSHLHVKIVSTQSRSIEGYTSHLDNWRKTLSTERHACCALGCTRDAQDFAIAQIKEDGYGNDWHYAPLCPHHLRCADEIEIESIDSVKHESKKTFNIKGKTDNDAQKDQDKAEEKKDENSQAENSEGGSALLALVMSLMQLIFAIFKMIIDLFVQKPKEEKEAKEEESGNETKSLKQD